MDNSLKMCTVLRWLALFGALAIGGFAPAIASITDYPFRLLARAGGGEHVLVAQNDGPAPITVHVSLAGENCASDRGWPLTATVAPYAEAPLGRVYAAHNAAGDCDFRFRYSHHFGRSDAPHDSSASYRLPFQEGHAYTVTQAYGGRLATHNKPENLYAVDFAMPRGTPVLAARAGVVIDVTLSHDEGGYDIRYRSRANVIAVVHDDGTVAEYAHLSPGESPVELGQRVEAGDLLGYSGNTGYSSGPHLHFVVYRPVVVHGKVSRLSVPVMFHADDSGARFSVVQGSTVTANYGSSSAVARQLQTLDASLTAMGSTSLGDPPDAAP